MKNTLIIGGEGHGKAYRHPLHEDILLTILSIKSSWKRQNIPQDVMVIMAEMLLCMVKENCPYEECCECANFEPTEENARIVQLYCINKRIQKMHRVRSLWEKVPIDKTQWNSTPEIQAALAEIEALQQDDYLISKTICPLVNTGGEKGDAEHGTETVCKESVFGKHPYNTE